jgi:hypothetical protein
MSMPIAVKPPAESACQGGDPSGAIEVHVMTLPMATAVILRRPSDAPHLSA